jgi:CO/xanthine dehydrogenase Mo-binding subunit
MSTPVIEKEITQETPAQKPHYKVIGTRPIRHDGVDKVTGRALYGADVRLNGMLYGKVLRSPHAHARILSIDVSQALALPGVKAVITSVDFPRLQDKVENLGEGAVNLRYLSDNCMASDKVLYHGHAVAAVAASSSHIAEEALALIRVEYEVLPPVLDVQQALREDAPILLDSLRTSEFGRKGTDPTNLAGHEQYQRGNLEEGFAQADVCVEREFHTATVHQGYVEPQNATAQYNADGQITVWTSTQGAHGARDQIADILQLPSSRVKVIPMEIGGGFGGKLGVYLEPIAVLLSRKSGGRPVQLVMTRFEVLAATGPTSSSVIRVKIGADKTGHITAAQASLYYAAGAYPGSPVGSGMGVIFAPYRLQNVQIDGYDVVTNLPRAAAYRAPGGTNAAYAAEAVIDELAEKLGMDPLQFRLLNASREGDRRPDGPINKRVGFIETLQAAQNSSHYQSPLPEPADKYHKVGRGVASGFWFNWGGISSVSLVVNPDGTVSLIEGSTDIGGTRVSLAMQLAETLGIRAEEIKPTVVDSDTVGYNDQTGGSRTTFATGWAVYNAGQTVIHALCERAALLWDVSADEVHFEAGVFSAEGKSLSFKELAGKLADTGGPIVTSISVHPETEGVAYATHIVDVAVDIETGKVDVLRYTAIQDVGTAIHPAYVEGQLQGGAAQGIGWALNEEYLYDEQGRLLNGNLLDYREPTALDLPMIDTILVEVPNPGHPYGVRGVGEVPIVPPAGAVANAIYHAAGVRMNTLPMSPRRVMEALMKEGA